VAYGERVPDQEIWLRVLTNDDYVATDGSLHENALKGDKIFQKRPRHTWDHELSGRRQSVCKDIEAEGADFVQKIRAAFAHRNKRPPPSKMTYKGHAFAPAGALRQNFGAALHTDVIHTPVTAPDPLEDMAHADFAIFGSTDTDLKKIRTFLQSVLKIAPPGTAHQLIAAPAPTAATVVPSTSQQSPYIVPKKPPRV
jgi:hypothetical protein